MDLSAAADRCRRAVAAHPGLIDAVWATFFVVASIASTRNGSTVRLGTPLTDDAAGWFLLLAVTLPYYVRRKSPVTVFVISSLAVMVLSGLEYQEGVTPLITLFGAYTVGARCPARVVAYAYAYTVVGLTCLYLSNTSHFDVANLVSYTGLFAAALLFGWSLQSRAARLQALEDRADALEREHAEEARRALSEERLRIAQELHDVVAHSMGVIAVQAGAGMHVIDADPGAAKRSLEAISDTSRSTLTELRRLLGVLRDEDGERTAAYAPAPGLADLDALAQEVSDAGVATTLRVEGDTDGVPKGVELTTYRIAQEALTNVLKHGGPGAAATVTVTVGPGVVAVEIDDDGRGVDLSTDGTAGHGLVGMRERVAVYGGTLEAGPRRSGGFRVAARLPYGVEDPDDGDDTDDGDDDTAAPADAGPTDAGTAATDTEPAGIDA